MRPIEVINKYGRCIELISMDPYFHDVTIGLFFKEPVMTIYSYSNKPGLEERLKVMKERPNDLSNGITCKDLRSDMILKINHSEIDGIHKYTVTGDGNSPKPEIRYRAVVNGLLKYGGFEKIDNFSFKLKCNMKNDKLINLLLPLARNISATEESLAADELAGQMTTQSLGFAAN